MWAIVWTITKWLIPLALIFFAIPIYNFSKYYFVWDFSRAKIEFTLQKLWEKAGVIEIQGGAGTGKSLLTILLTTYLKGKKWSNVPNVIPGCQELTLESLKKIKRGEYVNGLTGKNNLILIDESWNFFSKKELNKSNLTNSLGDLMFFLSETSKTDFKVFYVTKQGAKLPTSFNILSENRSAQIKTLGIEKFCYWWGKQYYYLELEVFGLKSKGGFLPKIKFLSKNTDSTIMSIPFSEDDFYVFDNAHNVNKEYSMNRLMSILDKMDPDKLIRMLGYRKSRTQKMQEAAEVAAWAKKTKNPAISNFQESEMRRKYWDLKRLDGWKPAEKKINQSEVSESKEPIEADIEMTTIYEKVSKNHRRNSKKWHQAAEKEINLAREADSQEEEDEEIE
jgi:hypothetical protein